MDMDQDDSVGDDTSDHRVGIVKLYEGQPKNFTQAKVSVDFSFVEHLEYNCIEIIAMILPMANAGRTSRPSSPKSGHASGGRGSRPSSVEKQTPQRAESDSGMNSSVSVSVAGNINQYLNTGAEAPVVRLYVDADRFYEKVIADKKALDKKNRRAEQSIPLRSNMAQNLASSALLNALAITAEAGTETDSSGAQVATTVYSMKLPKFDGVRFDCTRPDELIPHEPEWKISSNNNQQQHQQQQQEQTPTKMASMTKMSSTLSEDDSAAKPARFGLASALTKISRSFLGEPTVEESTQILEHSTSRVRETTSMFNTAIDNIKDMFDFRQKFREEQIRKYSGADDAKAKKPKKKRQDGKEIPDEKISAAEAARIGRISVTVQPTTDVASFAELAALGREGKGGGDLSMVAGRGGRTGKMSKEATAAAAKTILGASGVNAATLSGQTSIEVGGKVVAVKKPALLPSPLPMLRAISGLSSLGLGKSTRNMSDDESTTEALGHAPLGRRSSRLMGFFSSDKKGEGGSGSDSGGHSSPARTSLRYAGTLGTIQEKGERAESTLSAQVAAAFREESVSTYSDSATGRSSRPVQPTSPHDTHRPDPRTVSPIEMPSDVCSESHVVIDSASTPGSSLRASIDGAVKKRPPRRSLDRNPADAGGGSGSNTGRSMFEQALQGVTEDPSESTGGRSSADGNRQGTSIVTTSADGSFVIGSGTSSPGQEGGGGGGGRTTAVTSGVTIKRSFVGLGSMPPSALVSATSSVQAGLDNIGSTVDHGGTGNDKEKEVNIGSG